MNEILKVLWQFHTIIITCRTQFFPSEQEEPQKTGYSLFGPKGGKEKFLKLYIAAFSNRDIKLFLYKRYNHLNILLWDKIRRARNIIRNCPQIVIRPMILGFIDDLLKNDKTKYNYSYQLYSAFIDTWIERESIKDEISRKYASGAEYCKLLSEFSRILAIDLYLNRNKRNGLQIHYNEINKLNNIDTSNLFPEKNLGLSGKDKQRRSLLNRNSEGYFSFAHVSILEYLLAREAISDYDFYKNLDFTGMNTLKRFHNEMFFETRLKQVSQNFQGVYCINNIKREFPLQQLNYQQVSEIRSLVINGQISNKPGLLVNLLTKEYIGRLPLLNQLVFINIPELELLYTIQDILLLWIMKNSVLSITQLLNSQADDCIELTELLNILENLKLVALIRHVKKTIKPKLLRILSLRQKYGIYSTGNNKINISLLNNENQNYIIKHFQEDENSSSLLRHELYYNYSNFMKNLYEKEITTFEKLQNLNKLFEQIEKLQNSLPSCEFVI